MKKNFLCILFLMTCFMLFMFLTFKSYNVYASEGNIESDLFNGDDKIVQVFNYSDKTIYVTDNDIFLMSQVVYAESNSEPFKGKVAVASVILNRLTQPGFPKTVEGVIKQKGAFSCLNNGKISVVPDEASYRAVLEALKGNDPTSKATFFYNPKIATCQWMKNANKKNVTTIGNHVFFVVN